MLTIAIASGKGGTGKTTVAVNLAMVFNKSTVLADCDVEEPNVHLFLRPEWKFEEPVTIPVPEFDKNLCTGQARCREACRFNAIVVLGDSPLLFPELCHSCGACTRACPEQAITEIPRLIGKLNQGQSRSIDVIMGTLNIGEARSSPIIQQVRARASSFDSEICLIDAPPGTTCPVVESVRDVDYVVLVTEPTPFGYHDLTLAIDMCKQMNLKFGVVLNRSHDGNEKKILTFLEKQKVPILAQIPFSFDIATIVSNGELLTEANPEYHKLFSTLAKNIELEVHS